MCPPNHHPNQTLSVSDMSMRVGDVSMRERERRPQEIDPNNEVKTDSVDNRVVGGRVPQCIPGWEALQDDILRVLALQKCTGVCKRN